MNAVVPAKELRRILDKSRWDAGAHQWTIPAVKQRNVNESFMLPDIHNKGSEQGYVSSSIDNSNIQGGWQGTAMVLPSSVNGIKAPNSRGFSPRLGDQLAAVPPPLESQTPRSRINSGRNVKQSQGQSMPQVLNNGYGNGHGVAGNFYQAEDGGNECMSDPVHSGATKPPKAKKPKKKKKVSCLFYVCMSMYVYVFMDVCNICIEGWERLK